MGFTRALFLLLLPQLFPYEKIDIHPAVHLSNRIQSCYNLFCKLRTSGSRNAETQTSPSSGQSKKAKACTQAQASEKSTKTKEP